MPQVVQQGGGDQRIACAFALAQRGRLQGVLEVRDRFAGVLLVAAVFKQGFDLV
jgi:hypothetical protein